MRGDWRPVGAAGLKGCRLSGSILAQDRKEKCSVCNAVVILVKVNRNGRAAIRDKW